MEKENYTVFVVEDSDVYRSILMHSIESEEEKRNSNAHYKIYGFPSGEMCLQYLHLKPDIVILDYFLNGGGYQYNIDGLTVLKRIKKFSPLTEVIIVSCQQSIDVMKRFVETGIRDYIKKEGYGQFKLKQAINRFVKEKEGKRTQFKFLRYAAILFILCSASALIFWLIK